MICIPRTHCLTKIITGTAIVFVKKRRLIIEFHSYKHRNIQLEHTLEEYHSYYNAIVGKMRCGIQDPNKEVLAWLLNIKHDLSTVKIFDQS